MSFFDSFCDLFKSEEEIRKETIEAFKRLPQACAQVHMMNNCSQDPRAFERAMSLEKGDTICDTPTNIHQRIAMAYSGELAARQADPYQTIKAVSEALSEKDTLVKIDANSNTPYKEVEESINTKILVVVGDCRFDTVKCDVIVMLNGSFFANEAKVNDAVFMCGDSIRIKKFTSPRGYISVGALKTDMDSDLGITDIRSVLAVETEERKIPAKSAVADPSKFHEAYGVIKTALIKAGHKKEVVEAISFKNHGSVMNTTSTEPDELITKIATARQELAYPKQNDISDIKSPLVSIVNSVMGVKSKTEEPAKEEPCKAELIKEKYLKEMKMTLAQKLQKADCFDMTVADLQVHTDIPLVEMSVQDIALLYDTIKYWEEYDQDKFVFWSKDEDIPSTIEVDKEAIAKFVEGQDSAEEPVGEVKVEATTEAVEAKEASPEESKVDTDQVKSEDSKPEIVVSTDGTSLQLDAPKQETAGVIIPLSEKEWEALKSVSAEVMFKYFTGPIPANVIADTKANVIWQIKSRVEFRPELYDIARKAIKEYGAKKVNKEPKIDATAVVPPAAIIDQIPNPNPQQVYQEAVDATAKHLNTSNVIVEDVVGGMTPPTI